jgi:hypothetical protein
MGFLMLVCRHFSTCVLRVLSKSETRRVSVCCQSIVAVLLYSRHLCIMSQGIGKKVSNLGVATTVHGSSAKANLSNHRHQRAVISAFKIFTTYQARVNRRGMSGRAEAKSFFAHNLN